MTVEDFVIQQGDDEVPWRLFGPEQASREWAVLWLQGWMSAMDSHREGVQRMAEQAGMAFATLDYAGHGRHKLPIEQSTHRQQLDEVTAVYDQLKERGFEKVIVIGGSFGGYMAALLTAKRAVQAAILRAPANYPDDTFELTYDQAKQRKSRSLQDTSANRAVSQFEGFMYVLQHELDEVVPSETPRLYFEQARKGNYLIIPKTKHSPKLMKNPPAHYEYIEHIIGSLLKAIGLQDRLDEE